MYVEDIMNDTYVSNVYTVYYILHYIYIGNIYILEKLISIIYFFFLFKHECLFDNYVAYFVCTILLNINCKYPTCYPTFLFLIN